MLEVALPGFVPRSARRMRELRRLVLSLFLFCAAFRAAHAEEHRKSDSPYLIIAYEKTILRDGADLRGGYLSPSSG